MSGRDIPDRGKAETGAALAACTGMTQASEIVEDTLTVGLGIRPTASALELELELGDDPLQPGPLAVRQVTALHNT